MMEWEDDTPVEDLVEKFRQAFIDNGDNMTPVDRDVRRAYREPDRSSVYGMKTFIPIGVLE